jgi:hypothetical protein
MAKCHRFLIFENKEEKNEYLLTKTA